MTKLQMTAIGLGAGVLGGAASALLTLTMVAKVGTTGTFELHTPGGDVVAQLTATSKGSAALKLPGREGADELVLSLTRAENAEKGPVVSLLGSDAKPRATLGLDGDSRPALRLLGAKGKERAVLRISPDGQCVLRMGDEKGGTRLSLGADADGVPTLQLRNARGRSLAEFHTDGEGTAQTKIEALRAAGIAVAESPADIGRTLAEAMP